MASDRLPDGYSIPDDDETLLGQCRVDTFRAGGKGGQHQNRTESGVRLTHHPTGLVTLSRTERSQHRNRELALGRLRQRLEALALPRVPRRRTRIPPSQRRKRLEDKRRRSGTKKLRRPPDSDD